MKGVLVVTAVTAATTATVVTRVTVGPEGRLWTALVLMGMTAGTYEIATSVISATPMVSTTCATYAMLVTVATPAIATGAVTAASAATTVTGGMSGGTLGEMAVTHGTRGSCPLHGRR